MRQQGITAEQSLARLASKAHGVVTRTQLLRGGLTPAQIRSRLGSGALLPEYRGVYRVGHRAPSVEARYLAAVRGCGEDALLSGKAAGYLFGFLHGPAPSAEVITRTVRRVEGVATRRSRRRHPQEAATWRQIPVTSVPRTLVDLAGVLREDELARACHEAGVRFRTTPAQVEAVLARYPHAPGAGKLRAVLRGELRVTLSTLEARFLRVLRKARLPLPETNRPAGGWRVDCRWPRQRLIVELDSYRYHSSRHSWELDRRREREARALGDEFRRFSYGDVFEDRRLMLAELRTLLGEHRDA